MSHPIGRACELRNEAEVADLCEGMDFREPRFRREVFLRFYEFHLRYRAHPGCIYYVMPGLAAYYGWSMEERLWFAFLNGNTQNPVTSWLIFRCFPSLNEAVRGIAPWFAREYKRLAFDTDRRYHKKSFLTALEAYAKASRGEQESMFRRWMRDDREANFRSLWKLVEKHFYGFGRLSAFSYLEYLAVMGLEVACDQLFLHDLNGSKSHRNGLAKVLGRDDLDWHDSNPLFDGRYSPAMLEWLTEEGAQLLEEARRRMNTSDYAQDVGYFTLESALCTYKSWHRPNRRYPNVYNDMFRDRIVAAEEAWGERLEVFWKLRVDALPKHLRVEDNPADPGVVPAKQNHYRTTGQVIMMDHDWACFRNDFNDEIRRAQGEDNDCRAVSRRAAGRR